MGVTVCPAVSQSVAWSLSLCTTTAFTQQLYLLSLPRMSETKPSSELLSAIASADTKALKDVATVENPAAKHDMAMFGVAKFDKNKLKAVETVEKNSLPTADDLKDAKDQEKSH